jgi:hypothetical protein
MKLEQQVGLELFKFAILAPHAQQAEQLHKAADLLTTGLPLQEH